MKIIIFGTGHYYETYKYRFRNEQILALTDNNRKKIGTVLDGYMIVDPNSIMKINFDKIVILVNEYEAIKEQLLDMGICQNEIITIDSMDNYKKYRKFKHINAITKKDTQSVLLVSHEMNLRGAPLMLLNLGKTLIRKGFNVTVMSALEGDLCNYFMQNDIEVIIVDAFDFDANDFAKYFSCYNLIIVNTLAMWRLIKELSKTVYNVVWWLHEEEKAYEILNVPKDICDIGRNIHVYGVGKRAIDAWQQFVDDKVEIKNLLWGIEKECSLISKRQLDECVLAVIGTVCYIKGQDILINVLQKNKDVWKDKIQVWFIGNISEEQKYIFENIPNVKCFGVVSHDEVMRLYDKFDVVVSVSRNDTMPVNLIEGMMKRKVCLSSDSTGVADYIKPYCNGLVFQSENVTELEKAIEWLMGHKEKFKEIGEEAYITYKRYFSMEQFADNLTAILDRYL